MKINTHNGLPAEYERGYLARSFSRIDDAVNALDPPIAFTKTASFSLERGQTRIICNGSASITVTLPSAVKYDGPPVCLKTIAAYTVVSASSNVIPLTGGAASTGILAAAAGTWAVLVSDGANWVIVEAGTSGGGGGGGLSDADYGDVTVSGTGTVITIDNDVVTFAKMQNISTDRLLGRDTAGTGDVEQLTVGGGIEFTGSGGIQSSAFTGDVTKSAGGTAMTIANDVVTYAKMQNVTTARLLGRATAGSGDTEEITLGTNLSFTGTTLNASGGGLSDGDKGDITVSSSAAVFTIDNDVVTYAKMQNVSATSRILGRKTASAGDTEECTLSEILDFIGSAAQGDILYRGASAWARLAAGTAGYYLQTGGSGANPAWAAVVSAAMTVTNKTADYSYVLADANNCLRHTSGTTHTFTIPLVSSQAFPIGTTLTIRVTPSAEPVVLHANGTLYIAGNSSTGDRGIAPGGVATVLHEDTDVWVISGTGVY